MDWLILATSLITLGVSALCLYKVRKIHIATYTMTQTGEQTRQETLTLYSQVQAYDGLMRLLDLPAPLPPLRGWAASPDFLYAIARHARRVQPAVIVECSSGSSTVTLARCCQLNGKGHVYSLEHEPYYARQTRAELQIQGLSEWATVVDAPLVKRDAVPQPWYDTLGLPASLKGRVDMLVIDGPPASTAPQARYPAVPVLWDSLSPEVHIFLDDADRPEEKEAVKRWVAAHGLKEAKIPCEKGCTVLSQAASSV